MAVNVRKRERQQSQRLRQIQDRPIPIETHGVDDQRLGRLIDEGKAKLTRIKDTSTKELLSQVVESLKILRGNKTPTDAIRRNIETLWKSLSPQTAAETEEKKERASKIVSSGSSSTVINNTAKDEEFFGYDISGEKETSGLIETELTLDTQIIQDIGFNHTAGNAEIEVTKRGSCDIDADASFDVNEGDIVEFKLQINSGVGWVDIEGSKSYCGV
jgi:hypothetical protein